MKEVPFGWCVRRTYASGQPQPLTPPKSCRICGGTYKVVRPNRMAVYACARCDFIGGKRARS